MDSSSSSSARPAVVVTNDDGIHSFFLAELVRALIEHFSVFVFAPDCEKSWIGRAVTRHKNVTVTPSDLFPCPAWEVTGTPTDCVNIALEHYLKDKSIQAVVSGINVGYNVTTPLILGSGTIGGAVEGAAHHLPSFAGSMAIRPELFAQLKETHGKVEGGDLLALQLACKHFSHSIAEILQREASPDDRDWLVHNFNYPFTMSKDSALVETAPLTYSLGSLFQKVNSADQTDEFTFTFPFPATNLPTTSHGRPTDLSTVKAGNISYSKLRFAQVGQPVLHAST